jgi:hypothetical protein
LWISSEKLPEIIHGRRENNLIVRAAKYLADRNSNEATDDLGINSDDMAVNDGLKHHPVIIVLHHL